jgi:hypothetical protein
MALENWNSGILEECNTGRVEHWNVAFGTRLESQNMGFALFHSSIIPIYAMIPQRPVIPTFHSSNIPLMDRSRWRIAEVV